MKFSYFLRLKTLAVLLICLGLALSCSYAYAKEEYVIRFTTYKFDDTSYGKLRSKFIEELQEASGNRFKVEILEQSNHHNYPDFAAQIETDHMDLALLSYEGLSAYSPKFQALYAPYLFENYALAHDVLDKYVINWLNEELLPHNICIFGFLDFGYRQFTTHNVEIRTPDDMKYIKIAVAPLPGMNETTAAFGARPVNIEFTQLYDSLKMRQVVGQENTLSVINALKFYEVQNKLILTNHVFMTMPILVNLKFYKSLPKDLQEILKQQILKMQKKSREIMVKTEQQIIKDLEQHGMEVISPDLTKFVDHVDEAYYAFAQAVGSDEMTKLLFEINRARFELNQGTQQEKIEVEYDEYDDDADDDD